MAAIIADRRGYLLLQFRYRGVLCREYLGMHDTRDNRRIADKRAKDLAGAIRQPDFDYSQHFPESRNLARFGYVKAPTLMNYWNRWLAMQDLAKATRYDYECLGRAFNAALGEKRIDEITAADIRETVKPHVDAGRIRRPIMWLQRMRTMLDEALDEGLIEKNPARRVKNPRSRTRREIIEPLTDAETERIRKRASGQDLNMIEVMLGAGIRPGELLALRPGDVDLKNRKLVIAGSLSRFGEGATKTAGSTRVVELVDGRTLAALRRQMKVHRIAGPLFANERGAHLSWTNWRQRNWLWILGRSEVDYRNPYVLRHTYAVRMLESGRDVIWLAKQMGHTSAEMIFRHYARWIVTAPEGRRAAAGKF